MQRNPMSSTMYVGLTVAVLLGGLLLAAAPSVASSSSLEEVQGIVEVGHGEPPVWQPAKAGHALAPGDRIRTGRDGRAEVRLDSGTIRLYPNSLLRLPAGQGGTGETVELDRGSSIFDVIKRATDRFEVDTPDIVVSVKGTRFSVDLTGELASVAVFRGTVGVRSADMERALETLVREGFVATGGRDRAFELDVSPGGDPWDGWSQGQRLQDMTHHRVERMLPQHQLERARAAAMQATTAEVVQRAAERSPRVAKEIARLRKDSARDDPGQRDSSASAAPPAKLAEGMGAVDPRHEAVMKNAVIKGEVLPPHMIDRLKTQQESMGFDLSELSERVGPNFDSAKLLSVIQTELTNNPPGTTIDPTEVMAVFEELMQAYPTYAEELAKGGATEYEDLLTKKMVGFGLTVQEAEALAAAIAGAVWVEP